MSKTGDTKTPEEMNEERREVKAKQQAQAHAASVHRHDEELPEFDSRFQGKFTPETEAQLAEIVQKHEFVTVGHIYELVQQDRNLVRIELTGPAGALDSLGQLGETIVVRPFAFRSLEEVFKKDPETGEMVPQLQDSRTPMRVKEVLVPTTGGWAVKFKYNGHRRCVVVC